MNNTTRNTRRPLLYAIVAAVLAVLLTACSVSSRTGTDVTLPPAASQSPIAPPTSVADEPRYITAVFNDAQDEWSKAFAAADVPYSPAQLNIFNSTVHTACGTMSADSGPFYCPGDSTVYLDLSFFDQLEQQYGVDGAFAQAYVVAHEVGHHIQTIAGTTGQVAQLQARNPLMANKLSVLNELQADCYAGVWAHSTYQRGFIGAPKSTRPCKATQVIGDDFQQQAAYGRVNPQQWTHGSSAQREKWLMTGYDSGETASCNTFAALNQRA